MSNLLKYIFVTVFIFLQWNVSSQVYKNYYKDFEQPFIAAADSIIKLGASISYVDAATQLTNNTAPVSVALMSTNKVGLTSAEIYKKASDATVIISRADLCIKCSHTHINPSTGYFISSDGVCVTNYHVVNSYCSPEADFKPLAFVVRLHDGRNFSVKSILAASSQNDLAILLVDTHGEKVPSLALAADAPVGDDVFVVSHPQELFLYICERNGYASV